MSLSILFSTFANNLLPILLLSGAGFAVGKFLSVDSRTIGRVVFYIFAPMLVFNLLLHNDIKINEAISVIVFTITMVVIMGLLTLAFGLTMKLDRSVLVAILITTMFGNSGNYGLPLVSFAFGENGLRYGGLYFVTTSVLFNTAGVLIASLGHLDFKQAALGMLKVPTVYAVLLAALLNRFHIALPVPLERAVELAANGTIPMMLVLLGVELTRVQWSHSLRALGLATSLRLLAGPLVGLLLAIPFGLTGAARQGNLVQTATPAAVTNTVLATEYNLDASLVTAIIFIGTILSPLTLTPLLVYLGR